MKSTGPQITSELRNKLQFEVGRHLYGVLGGYAKLARFEQDDLAQSRTPQGDPFPLPVNLNHALLARIEDARIRGLVADEARRPVAVLSQLEQDLGLLLSNLLAQNHLVVLKQFELLFAFGLDFGVFRTRATNQNHIVLLLPGERRGDHVTLFHEAEPRFHRMFPGNIIADNHLWELTDG
jgi:hypothetical protein